MMARMALSLALSLLIPAAAMAGGPTTVEEAVAAVEAKYSEVNVMNAQFVQTVRNPMFGDDVQSGEVTLARPSKMRWNFGDGARQFVTNGSTMWIYTQAENQVIQYDGFTATAGGAESLLSSLDTLDELYNVSLVSSEPTVLSLEPKEEGQFKTVTLTLNAELLVDRVAIVDAYDSVTEIDFEGMQLNLPTPDSLFVFEVPEGAVVVDAGTL